MILNFAEGAMQNFTIRLQVYRKSTLLYTQSANDLTFRGPKAGNVRPHIFLYFDLYPQKSSHLRLKRIFLAFLGLFFKKKSLRLTVIRPSVCLC